MTHAMTMHCDDSTCPRWIAHDPDEIVDTPPGWVELIIGRQTKHFCSPGHAVDHLISISDDEGRLMIDLRPVAEVAATVPDPAATDLAAHAS